MSKAAELAALIGSQTALSNRNLVINGAMQVAQRGTSASGQTSVDGYPCVDRFKVQANSSGTFTFSQSTTAPDGFANSFKVDCTTADASPNYLLIFHRMEGQNLQQLKKGTANAESLTLSFWVRSSKTGTYQANLRDHDNGRLIGQSYAISSANTWEYKSLTFAGDTTGTLGNDNGNSFAIEWWLAAGSTYSGGAVPTAWESASNTDRAAALTVAIGESTSDDFYLTGVQLEVGEKATPFEHRSMGDELARCQRYFFNPMAGGNGQSAQITFHSMLNMGGAVSTGNNGHLAFHVPFPVSMRAAPTLTHDLANTKIVTSAPSGTQVAFYIQNQGYRNKAGNGNLNTLSRATGTSAGCLVGTYYISPNALAGDQIQIGASNQFHFSAEL